MRIAERREERATAAAFVRSFLCFSFKKGIVGRKGMGGGCHTLDSFVLGGQKEGASCLASRNRSCAVVLPRRAVALSWNQLAYKSFGSFSLPPVLHHGWCRISCRSSVRCVVIHAMYARAPSLKPANKNSIRCSGHNQWTRCNRRLACPLIDALLLECTHCGGLLIERPRHESTLTTWLNCTKRKTRDSFSF